MPIDRRVQVGSVAAIAAAAIAVAATSCNAGSSGAAHTPLPAERLGEPKAPPNPAGERFLREVRESDPEQREGAAWGRRVNRALEQEQKKR